MKDDKPWSQPVANTKPTMSPVKFSQSLGRTRQHSWRILVAGVPFKCRIHDEIDVGHKDFQTFTDPFKLIEEFRILFFLLGVHVKLEIEPL